jgi:feruloyl esterase
MRLFVVLSYLLSACAASPSAPPRQTFQQKCLAFQPQKHVRNSTLTRLEYVTNGTTLLFPDNDSTCGRARQLVGSSLCRIALSIPTSKRSSFTYELWLPESWSNSRILATGNGGIDGCVKYEDLAYGTTNGFATYGTNNGKNGTSGVAFYQNDDIGTDFSWRSLHTSVETSKKLVKLFYSKSIGKSYYLGCSLGGRMGIESSTRFPHDFDGIVAGAPGVDFNNLVSARAQNYTITGNTTSPNFINAALWAVINKEILAQCDTIDKVADGIIEDPNKCKFVPERMQCQAGNTTNCLSSAQVNIVKGVFSDFRYPLTGKLIYSAMQPGSEVLSATRLYAGVPFAYSEVCGLSFILTFGRI